MPYTDKEMAKVYQKIYHLRTWPNRKEQHKESKSKRRTILALWLKEYKLNLSCLHCKENHPACLDFHHVNTKEKEGTVANMISEGYSTATILKEIKKCIVLCKNCHAKIHFNTKSML